MSIGKSALFIELRKSLGQYKYFTNANGDIIGSFKGKKNPTFKDPVQKEARDLRITGYGGCGKLTRVLKDILNLGFLERKKTQSGSNAFAQRNMKKVCTATRDARSGEIVLEYNFHVMEVSSGNLDPATVKATVDLEAGSVTFVQDAEVIPGGLAREDDKMYACLFSAGNSPGPHPGIEYSLRAMLVDLRDRGEGGSTTVQIPAGWNKSNFFIYAFACSDNKRYSSPTTRLYPPPTADEAAIAELEKEWEEAELQLAIAHNTATREQLQAIKHARANVRTVIDKAEQDAINQGIPSFEAKMNGIKAGIELYREAGRV